MRTIYVDILIAVNVFIDFMLITCTAKFLHIKVKFIRLVLGSLLGGILSLAALLPKLFFLLNIAVNLFGTALIVITAFGFCGIKIYLRRIAVYFTISFIFCGIMIAIYTAFRPQGMAIYNNVVYFNISPALLIILTLVCYYILYLIKRLTKGVSGFGICCVEIILNGNSCIFNAKTDTGCNLKEPFSGYPVIIAEKELLNEINFVNCKMRIIPFESLGGGGIISGFKPDKILIDGKEISSEIYIGVCENVILSDVKALIPPELTE